MAEFERTQIAELEQACRAEPGAAAFAALAELYRQEGRLDEAERVAREGLEHAPDSPAGRAVLLLVLEDSGRRHEARQRLEAWARAELPVSAARPDALASDGQAPDPGGALSESEFEQAFASAEPDLAQMITPDRVAEEAALRVDGDYGDPARLETSPTFATRTMADLLERQGDSEGAARIRAALGPVEPAAHAPVEPAAQGPILRAAHAPVSAPRAPFASAQAPEPGVLATLERWLANARRLQT